jgi:nucleoside-diphosphate-sugar epimerase
VLGRALTRQLVERGHSVLGLTRNPAGEQLVHSLGSTPVTADVFDSDSLARASGGADVIVHAATSIPVKTRVKQSDFAANDRLRRDGTQALAVCATKIGARQYLQQSLVGVARPEDGSFFDEDSMPQPDEISRSAYDGEQIARGEGQRASFAVSVLRCGWFYGPDAAHTKLLAAQLLKRRVPIIGDGSAVLSCIHTEDVAGAFVAACEEGPSWNLARGR